MTSFNLIDIVDLLEKANEIGIQISFDDNELIVQTRKESIIDASFLHELKNNKEYLIEYFRKHHNAPEAATTKMISTGGRHEMTHIPLSFSQERLWFIDQLEGSVQYHQPMVMRVRGTLRHNALAYALQQIVNRHEILRTVIAQENGKAFQQINEKDQWQLKITDEPIYKDDVTALQAYIRTLIAQPFDLSRDHMMRAHLIVQYHDEYVLVINVHHIASDGWSTGIIIRELIELYRAYVEERPANLQPLPLQYADYAIWQRRHLSGDAFKNELDYWKNKLNGATVLNLPLDHPRPAIHSARGATCSIRFSAALTMGLQILSRQQDTTLFMTLLAAFKVLLYRYSAQDDICVGIPTAGRTRQELEGLIGFFVNTLALRSDLGGNPTFTALLQQVKDTTLSAYDHQEVPFERIVEAVVKQRDLNVNPLFQVMFMLQNVPADFNEGLDAVSFSPEKVDNTTTMFDLVFSLEESGGALAGSVSYCTDLFDEGTIQRMIAHYERLLQSVVASPDTQIDALPLLVEEEAQQLLLAFNKAGLALPEHTTAIDLIMEQAALTPDATALVADGVSLTFRELDERSNQLAHYLIAKGIVKESLVPVCIERCPEMIIAMLGILKAGGAYVPVDPEYPEERIRYMITDTDARIIISSTTARQQLTLTNQDTEVILLDEAAAMPGNYPVTPLTILPAPEQLAYVIYTSGSTGKPKGVMIEHRNMFAFLTWCREEFAESRFETVYATTSICFDLSVFEIFFPLTVGRRIRIVQNGLAIEKYLSQDEAVLVNTVPSVVRALLNNQTDLSRVTVLNMAGEPIPAEVQRSSALAHMEVRNLYGPTEDTTYSTVYKLTPGQASASIGRPIDHSHIYILGRGDQLLPVGIAGEICIGGAGVTRGYHKQPELTAEKYVADPFRLQPGNRMYRTGDLGRWLSDGTIEYMGRIDAQVKVRGYRIEPGEIENVLRSCPLVKEAAVLAKDDNSGLQKRLVGYIVPAGHFDREGITSFMKQKLPDYMVPALLLSLDKLPLTANGKIDRKALPDPDADALSTREYIAPSNDVEQVLADIWQELLGVSRVGIHDNFFELGGDSIVTIQVVSRAKRSGYELQPRDLFLYQTVASLAAWLASRKNSEITGEQGLLTGNSGLLPIQQWYFANAGDLTIPFNQSVLLAVDKSISAPVLASAIEQLVVYHDALRFSYQRAGNSWEQVYGVEAGKLEIIDLSYAAPETLAGEITRHAAEFQQSLQIEKGQVIRTVLFRTPDTAIQHRLLIIIHHLAVDGVSWRILLEDLDLLLKGNPVGEATAVLGHKSSSYRQWYTALEQYGRRRGVHGQQEYWQHAVAGYEPLRTDKIYDGKLTVADTASCAVKLDKAQTQRLLQEVPRAYHTVINDVLLCALARTLAMWSHTAGVVVGLEGHGREDIVPGIDTSRTVGWFTALYPVWLHVHAGSTPGASLKTIKEQLRKVPDKGLGYGVLKYINQVPSLQGRDPWDIIFNYLGQSDNAVKQDGLITGAPESSGDDTGAGYPLLHKLALTGVVQNGELLLQWEYSTRHFDEAGITHLATAYVAELVQLIDHCVERATGEPVFTPADYGLSAEITNEELDEFLDSSWNGLPLRSQISGLYRLTGLQEGMLFHTLYDMQGGTYVEQFSCEVSGLQEDLFRQSWEYLLGQHSILRSGFFHDVFSVPVQCVYKQVTVPMQVTDFRGMDKAAQAAAVKAFETSDNLQGFDLKAAPLMRINLLRLSEDTYKMVWTSHHILFDGWSLPVMVEELLSTYEALITGNQVPAVTEDRFEDYIRYQERLDKEAEEHYWRNYLQGLEEGSLLPFTATTTRLTKGGGNFKERVFRLDAATTERLTQFAQQHHITQNTLMQGVWAYLLYRYSGHRDVAYGITVSGRPQDLPGMEKKVGLFINTLPLYTVVDPAHHITSWLQTLQNSQLQSRDYQYTGLNNIQRWINVAGELFDSTITFQNYPVSEVVNAQTWHLQVSEVETHPHTNYPLTIIMGVAAETHLIFTFNNDLLSDYFIEMIAGHFEHVIRQIIHQKAVLIGDIELLPPAEQQQLENRAAVDATGHYFLELFERRVKETPGAVALVFEEEKLSYTSLHKKAARLAGYLQERGVTTGTLVPLCVERGPDMIIGMLGILKAGGVYVPVEPDFPAGRIKYMLEDTAAAVVVTCSSCCDLFSTAADLTVVSLDDDRDEINRSKPAASLPVTPEQLLYVIYTSGSTGTPKGVMVTHHNMADYMAGLQAHLPLQQCHSYGLLSSIATDLGNTVLFPALATGATLHLFSKNTINDAAALYHYFEQHAVDCIKIVPSHWKALSEPGRLLLPGKLLIFGGEALEAAVIDSIHASGQHCTVVNHYGPTETTVGKLLHVVSRERIYDGVVPVGKPFSNTRIYVLNDAGQRCPVGVPGELYIGGEGVAAGYLHHASLTAARFINDPYFPSDGVTLYRTGDLVKYLPDGNLVFLGRVDDQVKIRGYRVEPGEISRVLSSCAGVSQGVVIAREDKTGNKRLIGYVVAADFDRDNILEYLRSRLPEYMVPAALVPLAYFPLLPNGKIDRKGLPDPEIVVATEKVWPVTALEKTLAAIWSGLLEVEDIGLHDDFFALGGHSLLAIRVISAVRKQIGVEVTIGDVFDYPTIATLSRQLEQHTAPAGTPPLVKANRPARIPLSYSQERLWFIDQLEGSLHYHIPTVLRLKGRLNVAGLSYALQMIVNRHESLRTVIAEEDGVSYQRILAPDSWQMGISEHPGYLHDDIALQHHIDALTSAPFDLTQDHMLRVHLIRIADDNAVLVATLHHIASDGWSNGILVRELAALYEAFETGSQAALPAMGIQYADYAIWQRSYLSGKVLEDKLAYWKEKLTGVPVLNLPVDFPRPAIQSTRGAVSVFRLNPALSAHLQTLSQQQGSTLFMTLLAAFKVLLYRYTGQEDICVGSSIAGRTQQETEGLIGFFVNTLALRSDLSQLSSFIQVLQQVRKDTLKAYEHQDVPFEKVVEAVVKERDISRTPLFQVMFELQNTPEVADFRLGEIIPDTGNMAHTAAKFDLNISLQESTSGLSGYVEYCADLFQPETIARLVENYEQLLWSVIKDPAAYIRTLPILTASAQQQLLQSFNETTVAYPADKTLVALFEEQAIRTPDRTALKFGERTMTYAELSVATAQLAHYLRSKGVGEDVLVPVCIERSPEMVIAILGILRAGAAYVPVDPAYPAERIQYMLEDCSATLVVGSSYTRTCIPAGIPVIALDTVWYPAGSAPVADLPLPAPHHLSYVIYTSGSTGNPKGVMIEHRGMLNHLYAKINDLKINQDTVLAFTAAYTFDISVWQMFAALLCGGSTLIYPDEILLEPGALISAVDQDGVTILELVPSYLFALLQEPTAVTLSALQFLLVTGEAVSRQVLKLWFEHPRFGGIPVVNAYGPTEASDDICHYFMYNVPGTTNIPLGKPVQNLRIYILDAAGQLCPIGVPGEICVAGVGIARSYLHRPDLTASRFVTDPFSSSGERMYRTGDLGRWLPDGNVLYEGRIDEQVKIRGYRIEPGEIESILEQHEQVSQAVVLAKSVKDDAAGILRLIAYIVPQGAFDKEEVISWLKGRLPEYMVPAIFVILEQLPLTANKKIDRKALPDPDAAWLVSEYVAPRNTTEAALVYIWQELLGISRVGIYDNFFELGGHSLLVMRLVAAVRKQLEVALAVKAIFAHPVIASLATHIREEQQTGSLLPVIGTQQRPLRIPLSFNQERLWFVDQLEGSVHYHIPVVLRLEGSLDTVVMEASLRNMVNRHEVLRTVIEQEEGKPYQRILPENSFVLTQINEPVYREDEAALHQLIAALVAEPFNLASDHKLRGHLIMLAPATHVLVLTAHHIASDGLSTGIMAREFVEGYNAGIAGSHYQPAPLPLQYADFAIWQRAWLSGDTLDRKLAYWKQQLADVQPLNLPTDFKQPAVSGMRGGRVNTDMDAGVLHALQQLSRQQEVTLYMTLLAAYKVLLYRYSGQTDIVVGSSSAGRQQPEIEGLIGFFVNMLTLRTDMSNHPTFINLLQQVKQTTLDAFEHQDVPFEKIVEAVMKDRDNSRRPLFQVMFVMPEKAGNSSFDLEGITISTEPVHHTTARFNLMFSVQETSNGLNIEAEYSKDLFREDTVIRMMAHFKQLLVAIAAAPATQIDVLPLYDEQEYHHLLQVCGKASVPYSRDITFIDQFIAQAARKPEAIALAFEGRELTYRQLDEQSACLANYLRRKGVTTGMLVPLCIPRSPEMIIGMLGILKAGAAYVPLETDFPAERIRYMLEDTAATVIVSNSAGSSIWENITAATIVSLDEDAAAIAAAGSILPGVFHTPSALAYVIYTSGSTGTPKGVMITHQNLADYIAGLRAHLPLDRCHSFGLLSSIATDLGNTVLFPALAGGAELHLFSKASINDAAAMHDYFGWHRIDCIKIVASHWKALSDQDQLLLPEKLLIFGGEALEAAVIENIRAVNARCTVVNHYGPTETTIGKLLHVVTPQHIYHDVIPVGKVFSNTQVYVVSAAGQLCPVGIPGELYIGGEGVATGYLNNPELTAERFVDNFFTPEAPGKLYRTGDLVKYLPDGNLVFLGRVDDQVKIRGYRIEPGEIGRVLERAPGVGQGVVIAREDHNGGKRLIGYVIPHGTFDKTAIQTYLKEQLPEYMIPAVILEMEQFPMLPNGKINRKALPDPDHAGAITSGYAAPVNPTQERLTAIWAALLEVEQVGIYDDFFALGGHSLLAIRVISAIRKQLGAEVAIGDIFDYPTVAALSALLEERFVPAATPTLIRGERPEFIPLSYSQERLWFIDQLEGSTHYHLPTVLRLKGKLDRAALSHAWATIVNRHEILRTVIAEEEGVARQVVKAADQWQLHVVTNHTLRPGSTVLQQYIQSLIDAPFNLRQDDVLRVHLIEMGVEDHVLVVVLHHIASDGWSTGIMVKELVELYSAYTTGRSAQLPVMDIQYADYAIWQRQQLSGEVLEEKLAYWKKKLADTAPLELSTDYTRPAIQRTRGAISRFHLGPQLYADIQQLCKQEGTTLFMTLLAAFNVLLHRYSGQDDICVGTPVAGRTQQEMENLIGFFINTLALRNNLGNNPSFRTLLQQVKQTTLEAYEHQDVPFEKIVEAVVKQRDMSRSPLFQVSFVLQNTPDIPDLGLGNLELLEEKTAHTTAKWDLIFTVEETPRGLRGSVEYAVDLFREETVLQLIRHFEQLLQAVVKAPATGIDQLSFLSPEELQQLLYTFNDNATDYPRDKTVAALFEEQVALTPSAIALTCNGRSYTYATLDERAGKLAHFLRSKGVYKGVMVPICAERSTELIVGILAILKAGGAYVPIDATYPAERIRYMLADIGATLLLTTSTSMQQLAAEWYDRDLILLDALGELFAAPHPGRVSATATAADLAYVMYTSGSTGVPKGVMVTHENVVSLVKEVNYVSFSTADVILSTGSPSFDATTFEYWGVLLNGGRLVLCDEQTLLDSTLLKQTIRGQGVTKMWFTAGWLNQLVDTDITVFEGLTAILAGGEKLSEEHITKIRHAYPLLDVINGYGPTENTTFSLTYTIPATNLRATTPIGRPLNNRQVYVLDTHLQPVPVGVRGELFLSGSGLSNGYLHQPALTAEKFIPHPFSTVKDARIYRTGDIGRWLPDGSIEYLGRADDQVKIRGFRIEPGEIEHILQQCPLVTQAVVLVRTEGAGKKLAAYVVPAGQFEREGILAYLKNKLPDYMIPAILVEMNKLPVNANGKTDRKALLQMDTGGQPVAVYVAPRTKIETALTGIWEMLLEIPRAGIYDNFFELGGHSLLTIRLTALIRKEFGLEILIRELYSYPTIAALALKLEQQQEEAGLGKFGEGRLLLQEALPENSHIVLLNKTADAPPLFFLPGAGGLCDAYIELGRAFSGAYSFYSFQMQGVFEGERALDNMEAIAALCITWMKQIQPAGPYRLSGHSFGARLAFEMTKQLEAAGETVQAVFILDMQAVSHPHPMDLEYINNSMFTFFEQYHLISPPYPAWTATLKANIATLPFESIIPYVTAFVQEQIGGKKKQAAFVLRMLALSWYDLVAHNKYRVTGTVQAPLIVLKAAGNPSGKPDPYMGWRDHGITVQTVMVPGDHLSMVDGDNATVMAGKVIEILQQE